MDRSLFGTSAGVTGERYLGRQDEQRKAMQEFVSIRKERSGPVGAVEYVRSLRRGNRLERLQKK